MDQLRTPPQLNRHYVGVQYLRGIAAIFVILAHVGGMAVGDGFYQGYSPVGLVYGRIGVDIFFVISGFIITTISFEPNTFRIRARPADFVKRRFARIIPFMWLVVLLYAIIRFAGIGAFEALPYLRAATLWPVGDLRPNVIWTLRHEFLFYLVFAIAMLQSRRLVSVLVIWCLAPFVATIAADLGMFHLEAFKAQWPYVAFVFNNINLEFGCGVLVGLISLRGVPLKLRSYGGVLTIALAAIEFVVVATFNLGLDRATSVVAICAMSSAVVLVASLMEKETGLLSRTLELLGNASYSIYLLHGLIIMIVLNALVRVVPHASAIAVQVLCVLGAVGGGVLAYQVVEKPIVRNVRRLVD